MNQTFLTPVAISISEQQLGVEVSMSVFAAKLSEIMVNNGFFIVNNETMKEKGQIEARGTRAQAEVEDYYKQLVFLSKPDMIVKGKVSTIYLDKFSDFVSCSASVTLSVECSNTGEVLVSYTRSTSNFNITAETASYDAIIELSTAIANELIQQIPKSRIVEISLSGADYQEAKQIFEILKKYQFNIADPDYLSNFFTVYVRTNLANSKLIEILNQAQIKFKVIRSDERKIELSREDEKWKYNSQVEINWRNHIITASITDIKENNLSLISVREEKHREILYNTLADFIASLYLTGEINIGNIMLADDNIATFIQKYIEDNCKISISQNGNTYKILAELSLDKDNNILSSIRNFSRDNDEKNMSVKKITGTTQYTAIIINAVGLNVKPVFHPVIFNTMRDEVYGPNVVDQGRIAFYECSLEDAMMNPIAGNNPLLIKVMTVIKNSKGEGVNLVLDDANAKLFLQGINDEIIATGAIIIVDPLIAKESK